MSDLTRSFIERYKLSVNLDLFEEHLFPVSLLLSPSSVCPKWRFKFLFYNLP